MEKVQRIGVSNSFGMAVEFHMRTQNAGQVREKELGAFRVNLLDDQYDKIRKVD